MEPLMFVELLRHTDLNAPKSGHRPQTSHPRRQHLISRLRTRRRPPE